MNETTKRQMLQPTKDRLRDALRGAADTIQAQAAKLAWWEEHHEQAVAAALADDGMPRWLVGVLAFLLGALVVAVVEAVRA